MAYSRRADDDDKPEPPDDDVLEHKDAIRLAHKCLKTAKALHTEAAMHLRRSIDLLDPVCDAMGDDDHGENEGGGEVTGDGGNERAVQLSRVRAIRRRYGL